MRPDIKFGLIGGIVAVILLSIGTFLLSDNTTMVRTFQYLLQLAFIVSVIASIKQTRDLSPETLELRTGMKAGIVTSLIICLFMGGYNFIYARTIPKEVVLKYSEEKLQAEYEKFPVTDTSAKAFDNAVATYDSAFKAGNYQYARYVLERARIINPAFDSERAEVNKVNEKLVEEVTSAGNQLKGLFTQLVFFQLLMGMFVAFSATMIFRYRQQINQ
jgi:hypothetical protein